MAREENLRLWETAMPVSCLASRSERVGNWLRLQQGLARRDYAALSEPALALLKSGSHFSMPQFHYILQAALMGLHRSQGPAAALAFLQATRQRSQAEESGSLAFQMLEEYIRASGK
jgi:hypothetical protein